MTQAESKPSEHKTYFAPARRSSPEALEQDIQTVSQSPLINSLLEITSGLLAVLNENRQIITVNSTLLHMLGCDNPHSILGLRPGEAIHCQHATDEAGGCGTSSFCRTCGAAISIVASMVENIPVEKYCIVTVDRQGAIIDLFLRVKCTPLYIENQRYLLLFLQDITVEQQHSMLERVFFHDIGNTVSALKLSSQLLKTTTDQEQQQELIDQIYDLSVQLNKDVEIQRVLSYRESHTYEVKFETVNIPAIQNDIQTIFSSHPVSVNKQLFIINHCRTNHLQTDPDLLKRILINIIINAFEASDKDQYVKLEMSDTSDTVIFSVWNAAAMSHDVGVRVFQRNFTTKSGSGRGLGTYAMKLFGETYLQGKVYFSSDPDKGTTFYLELPKTPEPNKDIPLNITL